MNRRYRLVDLVYFFYYPYNRGKEVVNTIFGSHVGDWEHVTVRLTPQLDSQGHVILEPLGGPLRNPLGGQKSFYLAAHDGGESYCWSKVPKVTGTEHPIIYSAAGSHGSYLEAGMHKYGSAVGTDLIDYTHAGTPWDTWKKLECFDYNTKKGLGPTWKGTWPNWLKKDKGGKSVGNTNPASGPVTRWGNEPRGKVAGYWRLANGPTGPADKPCFVTPELD